MDRLENVFSFGAGLFLDVDVLADLNVSGSGKRLSEAESRTETQRGIASRGS